MPIPDPWEHERQVASDIDEIMEGMVAAHGEVCQIGHLGRVGADDVDTGLGRDQTPDP